MNRKEIQKEYRRNRRHELRLAIAPIFTKEIEDWARFANTTEVADLTDQVIDRFEANDVAREEGESHGDLPHSGG